MECEWCDEMDESSLVHGSVAMVLPSLSYSVEERVTTEKVLGAMGCLMESQAQGEDREERAGSGGRGGGRSCAGPEQGHGPSENLFQYQCPWHHHRYQDA